jgi:predicted RNA-binding protein
MELALAIVGISGTLCAAVLTQLLANRAEMARRAREDQTRWLSDGRRLSAALLAGALRLERQLWSACSQLDRKVRSERLPGHTSILLTPTSGVPPVLDELTRETLVEAVEDAFEALDALELLVAEVSLISTAEEAVRARNLLDSLAEVVGLLESFAEFDEAVDAVERSRAARDAYLKTARSALRVDGPAVAPDSRPRR